MRSGVRALVIRHTEGTTFTRRLRIIGIATLLATAIGIVFAMQYAEAARAAGQPVTAWTAFATQAVPWYIWVLFLPIILHIPDRWPASPGIARLAGANILLGLALSVLHLVLSHAILHGFDARPQPIALDFSPGLGPVSAGQVMGGLMIYGVLVGLTYMEHYRRAFEASALESVQLKAQVVTAELHSLRAQLCPHFLFNTLNSACGLIPGDPERAELMIAKLSQLLRQALQTDGIAEVTLAKELDFACAYLDIEMIRFEDRLRIAIDVADEVRGCIVPSFLLQPLLENAIHHAVAPSRSMRVLELVVHPSADTLVIEVRDDGVGLVHGALERRRDAIGLKSTRAKLELLYGASFTFSVQNRPTGGAVARVVVPLRSAIARSDTRLAEVQVA
jgi:two-component system, LytTR family, sensor kinase